MFIEQGITPGNKFWKYIVGCLVVLIAMTIGQMPLLLAVFAKSMSEGNAIPLNEETIMKTLDSNLTLFLLLVASAAAIGGLYLTVRFLHKHAFQDIVTSRKKIDWKRVVYSFLLWSVFSAVSAGVSYFASPEDFVWNFKPIPFLILLVISVLMVPIQTSSEELVFRGYLMQGFGGLLRHKWFPLIMTSLIFGLLHIANPEVKKMGMIIMVYYIGTGFMLGVMTLMDEGTELSLGFHAANNLIGALLVTSDWSVFQTNALLKDISEPSAGIDIILPVVIVYPILLFIFSRKYKWTDWRGKLAGPIHPILTEVEQTETLGNYE
jgi:membrane protease YdiL (CAAX protease family)